MRATPTPIILLPLLAWTTIQVTGRPHVSLHESDETVYAQVNGCTFLLNIRCTLFPKGARNAARRLQGGQQGLLQRCCHGST